MDGLALWSILGRIRTLQFVVRSGNPNGWNGSGSGTVAVDASASGVLIFSESGSWRPDGGRAITFTNVFRWSLVEPARVRLEHLRFGPEKPVYLFDLAPGQSGIWDSVSPHQCQEDCYSAHLEVRDVGFLLRWDIIGPNKREAIEYTYGW